jgi:hypothetical protein
MPSSERLSRSRRARLDDLTPSEVVFLHRAAGWQDATAPGYSAAGAGLVDYPAVFTQLASLASVPLIVQDPTRATRARARTDLLRWSAEASRR